MQDSPAVLSRGPEDFAMPTMLEMIKASAVPANLMSAAANGSLAMPAVETLEVLVYLTRNKVFGKQAKLTLAAWDLEATQAAVSDPTLPRAILEYFISPQNIRPKLLPGLIENPSVSEDALVVLATEGSRDVVRALLGSARARRSHKILDPLVRNPHLAVEETEQVRAWLNGTELRVVGGTESGIAVSAEGTSEHAAGSALTDSSIVEPSLIESSLDESNLDASDLDESEEAMSALTAFEREHAAELAAEAEKPFQPIGGTYGLELVKDSVAEAAPTGEPVSAPSSGGGAAAAAPARIKPKPKSPEAERVSVLQKIARLDVKGRVQLAVRGSKEERSILVRDGTKLVALAVLQSPKISDGEVEKFAAQKNVLEALLRGITMHRRFMKNYVIMRNLCFNPRVPTDVSMGLVKNLMVQDLKNLSGNKDVSETIRKMALRAFKQKAEPGGAKS